MLNKWGRRQAFVPGLGLCLLPATIRYLKLGLIETQASAVKLGFEQGKRYASTFD